MIDLRYVKKLIEMLDGSSVDSIEISSDKGMKLRISKTPQQRGTMQVAAPVAMPAMPAMLPAPVAPSMPTPADGMSAIAESAGARGEAPASKLLEIKSPMVGTFYSAPDPNSPSYASVGQRVSKGQIVCIIEAMKIMNEIESEYDGVVKEIVADNAHPVEYGQVLFRIDPNG
ncbi:acetyl-CoA carboxylase, biotin carboxyl carrier protein [Gemmatirosa kalamazoonensis]|uniref:Biotin carboxyl carrier protein of acetyl-CoA carboxylase n=1 Tax=Gemmatirosa kalamazoonensis TaxID=861299 RepID=W0RJW2_9BACT|nr:acetyl-CoA carboxylase biotin carboxyl carrier protein [Gemmatirosa kalamazoonensis]AHG91071.1 acetyl-CoA carboxylase, biotin carboxyl carrier protein [Gemmatirosa kalamazoonensis]